jgi:ketosteroid isomerase-like protein
MGDHGMRRFLFLALLLLAAPVRASDAHPELAVAAFLDAFRAMEPARFDSFFAPDATVFFPDERFPANRLLPRAEALQTFHGFFKSLKAQGLKRLEIDPLDLRVDRQGDVAVVTFLLKGAAGMGRRTLVLRQQGDSWQIVHLHASRATSG